MKVGRSALIAGEAEAGNTVLPADARAGAGKHVQQHAG
jgi:hypothetical protein